MGTYLNPGKGAYEEALRSEIYVDKTGMLLYLNTVLKTKQKYVSVSRPRRFGKTMAADMICAYYDRTAESRELFADKCLASGALKDNSKDRQEFTDNLSGMQTWDRYLGKFDVIRVVMTDFLRDSESVSESLKRMRSRILKDLSRAYPDVEYDADDLPYSMGEFYYSSRIPFVIVIDEWDAPFRVRKEDKEGQREYLDFLRDWLKDREYVALAYMTGILPIKKYGKHSALNMFDEYSMIAPMQLAPYTGFTEEEVKALCHRYGRDYEKIRDWYDGYTVIDIIPPDPDYKGRTASETPVQPHRYSLYSPLSVVKAVSTGLVRNYWNNTETYEALAEYIRIDYDGLKDTIALLMDGGRVKPDLSTYQNDMTTFSGKDDILALLIHLGYLGYDSSTGEVFIPNKEILDVFRTSTKSREWEGTFKAYALSEELLKATWAENADKVAQLVEKAHDQASNRTYHDESALSYGIQLAYIAAEKYYTKTLELDSGKGYADIVYLPSPRYPDKPVLMIELKFDKTTDTAMDQIRDRNYPERLEHYKGNILLVSINCDRDIPASREGYKHHSCQIERA